MKQGVLIFAQNNSEVDYTKLAIFAAEQVTKFLKVPVSIVTDNKEYIETNYKEKSKVFDKIIEINPSSSQKKQFHDGSLTSKILEWKNLSRSTCFDLSPYNETIVIDSDYIVNSNFLNNFWNSDHDIMLFKDSYDLSSWRDTSEFKYLNQYSIPFYWATVFYFKKTQVSQAFFDLIKHIKENWLYYKNLYSIDSFTFRNDFAFSIAVHIFNDSKNFNNVGVFPGKMYYTLDKDLLVSGTDNSFTFLIEKEKYNGEYTAMKVRNLDIHIMNKYSLSRFIDEQ